MADSAVRKARVPTDSIKDKVAIIGMGCVKFGERWDTSGEDLIVDAVKQCYEDAGVEEKDIDAAWFGTFCSGISGLIFSIATKLQYKPVTRLENGCATGTEAFRNACYAVASGACGVAMACGMEKLKDQGFGGLPENVGAGLPNCGNGSTFTAPGAYAMVATRYFHHYGITPEDGKKILARMMVKSHANGAKNPLAHLRKAITIDQVVSAPMIAWPLGLFDCCGVSDGAAAAIVVPAKYAKEFRPDPVYVKALQICCSPNDMHDDYDFTHVECTRRGGIAAYKEAGVTNPREEISMAEVHDCFSITELVTYEDLQWSEKGRGREDVEGGFFELDGGLPVQPDGGLKSFGHPVGASGIRMLYEMYLQLQGRAGERQLGNPRLGLTHNLGGFPWNNVVSVCIVGS
jgi:acetyl-CoA C-acetyltransferase